MPVYSQIALDILQPINSNLPMKQPGKFFTFFKFMDFIAKCSNCAYQPSNKEDQNVGYIDKLLVSEMLCLLLERMELSRGFSNLEKKTNKPHTSKITLLPSKTAI